MAPRCEGVEGRAWSAPIAGAGGRFAGTGTGHGELGGATEVAGATASGSSGPCRTTPAAPGAAPGSGSAAAACPSRSACWQRWPPPGSSPAAAGSTVDPSPDAPLVDAGTRAAGEVRRQRSSRSMARHGVRPLRADQLRRDGSTVAHAVPARYRALVLLTAGTGLRQGETFGVGCTTWTST